MNSFHLQILNPVYTSDIAASLWSVRKVKTHAITSWLVREKKKNRREQLDSEIDCGGNGNALPECSGAREKNHVTVSTVTVYRTECIIFTTHLRSSSRATQRGESKERPAESRTKTRNDVRDTKM